MEYAKMEICGPLTMKRTGKHMFSYDAIVIKGADHFLMMNRPGEFNLALEQAIHTILTKAN